MTHYLLNYSNLKIIQNNEMFKLSLDPVLLANFATIKESTKRILDIGTGNAPIPLILTTRTDAKIIGVEIQPEVYELALKSIKVNKIEDQITIKQGDIRKLYKDWQTDSYDLIVCNPPFFKISEQSILNVNDNKKIARHEITLNLNDIMLISKKLLKNNGLISIVHRPERLIEIINTMIEHNIYPKKIRFVYPKVNQEANAVLIEGSKNGKPGLKILPPLITHFDNGDYQPEILNYFKEN